MPWDVSNQAVHLWYPRVFGIAVEPLASSAEAVATWPDTATCVALRLLDDGAFMTVAPFGLYVNERLAILASAKHGLTGRNWVTRFNHEWANQLGIHRLTGTVKPTLAYASR